MFLLIISMLIASRVSLKPKCSMDKMCRRNSCSSSRLFGNTIEDKFPTITLDELIKDVPDRPDENPPRPTKLKNKYYGLRHGESEANMMGVISSDPIIGAQKHGLTATGVVQARKSAKCLVDIIGRENLMNVVMLSSYYKRARETAYECIDAVCKTCYEELIAYNDVDMSAIDDETMARLQTDKNTLDHFVGLQVIPKDELRERSFGQLDGTVLINYNRVWPVDLKNAYNTRYNVESVSQVVERVSRLVSSLENEYEGKHIVMASHADTLQIFQSYMSHNDVRNFSQYRFKNGELRDMEFLPAPVPLSYK